MSETVILILLYLAGALTGVGILALVRAFTGLGILEIKAKRK